MQQENKKDCGWGTFPWITVSRFAYYHVLWNLWSLGCNPQSVPPWWSRTGHWELWGPHFPRLYSEGIGHSRKRLQPTVPGRLLPPRSQKTTLPALPPPVHASCACMTLQTVGIKSWAQAPLKNARSHYVKRMHLVTSSLLRASLCKGQSYIWPPSFSSIFPRSGFQRKHFTRVVITCRIDHFYTTTSISTMYITHLVFILCISAPMGLRILRGADNCLPHNTQVVN